MMRVGIATDHGGFGLMQELVAHLRAAGHAVSDFGAHSLNPTDDYPDFVMPAVEGAEKNARAVPVKGVSLAEASSMLRSPVQAPILNRFGAVRRLNVVGV